VNREPAARPRAGAGNPLLGPGPALFGILNVTPDSFSDGGDFLDPEAAARRAHVLLDEGADVVDVGGESTRPGSDPVSEEEERRRVVPVVREILVTRPGALVSVDTYRAGTADAALEAGARIVNDVTALRGDPRMARLVADVGCPVVLMHMLGEPKTMQREPRYEDVTREVREFLARRAEHATAAGVEEENIILDPGIGFGKTSEHNLTLLARLDEIAALGFPGGITGAERAKDRVFGTVATTVLGYERGATLFRVHDVKANREALAVAEAVRNAP
jgi:dihydropteroate synthase